MFNMKKLWKKMCVLGVSAVTAISFSSPFVKAAVPGSDVLGQEMGAVYIAAPDDNQRLTPFATILLEGTAKPGSVATGRGENNGSYAMTSLTYSGHSKAIINSVSSVQVKIPADDNNAAKTIDLDWTHTGQEDPNTKVDLYLRVRDVVNGSVNSSSGEWKLVTNNNQLSDVTNYESLMRANPGSYKVYYYIDHLNTPYKDAGLPSGSVK